MVGIILIHHYISSGFYTCNINLLHAEYNLYNKKSKPCSHWKIPIM